MHIFYSEKITKQFSLGGFSLENISVDLHPGKITGVVGENGNGKTTLLRIIAGDLAIDSGELNYFNTINW